MAHGDNYKFHSVTQILGERRKIGLEFWYLYNTTEFCKAEGKKGREAGTAIHTLIEQHINGDEIKVDTPYMDEVTTGYKSFLLFKEEHPEYTFDETEVQLDCDEHKFSGKLDSFGKDKKDLTIFDWKGGQVKKNKLTIYPSMVEQVCMYSVGAELQFKKKIKRAIVVMVARNEVRYALRVVERDEIQEVFEKVCLPAISIFNYYNKPKEKK